MTDLRKKRTLHRHARPVQTDREIQKTIADRNRNQHVAGVRIKPEQTVSGEPPNDSEANHRDA